MMETLFASRMVRFSVLALALTACKGGADEDDTDTDTDGGGDDTVDTSDDGSDFFEPVSASMFAEFGVNGDGVLSSVYLDGAESAPALYITLTDARQTECTLVYSMILDGAGDTDADTDGGSDLSDWLSDQGFFLGFDVAPGTYEPLITQGCVLDPEGWGEDPHAGLIGTGWQVGVGVDLPTDVADAIDENGGHEAFFGTDITEEQVIGGGLRVPADFFSDGTRDLGGYGIVGEVDADMNVEADADGNLVLLDAADMFDGETAQPGFYRIFSLYGITFGN